MTIIRTFVIGLLVLCPAAATARDWHAPAPGSAERAQVMSALRSKLSTLNPDAGDLRFVVRELCVSDRTGWIATDPQSADGSNHYEPISASLVKRKGRWVVFELACSEVECAAGTSAEEIRRRIGPRCPLSSSHGS